MVVLVLEFFSYSVQLPFRGQGHGCNNNMGIVPCFERLVPDFPVGVGGLTDHSTIHSLI